MMRRLVMTTKTRMTGMRMESRRRARMMRTRTDDSPGQDDCDLDWITDDMFYDELLTILEEQATFASILMIDDVYESLAKHYREDVIASIKERQEENRDEYDLDLPPGITDEMFYCGLIEVLAGVGTFGSLLKIEGIYKIMAKFFREIVIENIKKSKKNSRRKNQ